MPRKPHLRQITGDYVGCSPALSGGREDQLSQLLSFLLDLAHRAEDGQYQINIELDGPVYDQWRTLADGA